MHSFYGLQIYRSATVFSNLIAQVEFVDLRLSQVGCC
jgi:hypothetical protein